MIGKNVSNGWKIPPAGARGWFLGRGRIGGGGWDSPVVGGWIVDGARGDGSDK